MEFLEPLIAYDTVCSGECDQAGRDRETGSVGEKMLVSAKSVMPPNSGRALNVMWKVSPNEFHLDSGSFQLKAKEAS